MIGQDPEPILENILNNLDEKCGFIYRSFQFYVFDTLLYFYNKTLNSKYLKPVELILKKLCPKAFMITWRVEFHIQLMKIIPHFEKMLYDNVQFVLLIAKF